MQWGPPFHIELYFFVLEHAGRVGGEGSEIGDFNILIYESRCLLCCVHFGDLDIGVGGATVEGEGGVECV